MSSLTLDQSVSQTVADVVAVSDEVKAPSKAKRISTTVLNYPELLMLVMYASLVALADRWSIAGPLAIIITMRSVSMVDYAKKTMKHDSWRVALRGHGMRAIGYAAMAGGVVYTYYATTCFAYFMGW